MQSGTRLYADEVPTELWIVKQNLAFYYEPDFDEDPEQLKQDGEAFQVALRVPTEDLQQSFAVKCAATI